MDDSLDSWFKREILIHEEALQRYLLRVWPRRQEVSDLRQETYARVYEAAAATRPGAARSFLFTTARHLMTDRIRRERVVSIEAVGDIDVLNVLVDEVSPEQRAMARQDLKRLAQAFDRLPPRCREVVWMRRVQDMAQKEIARRLGIGEKTVEKQISKGSRLLAHYMRAEADGASTASGSMTKEGGYEHGRQ